MNKEGQLQAKTILMHTSSINQKTTLLFKPLQKVPVLSLSGLDAAMVVTRGSQDVSA